MAAQPEGATHADAVLAGRSADGVHGHADAHHAHAGHGAGHGADDVAGDKRAAFLGLIGGVVVIFALMYGMVLWTNAQFAGHEGGERPAAEAKQP